MTVINEGWCWKGWMSKGLIELKWLEFGNAKLTGVSVTNPAAALDEVIGWWNPVNKMKCVKNRPSDSLVQARARRALEWSTYWAILGFEIF